MYALFCSMTGWIHSTEKRIGINGWSRYNSRRYHWSGYAFLFHLNVFFFKLLWVVFFVLWLFFKNNFFRNFRESQRSFTRGWVNRICTDCMGIIWTHEYGRRIMLCRIRWVEFFNVRRGADQNLHIKTFTSLYYQASYHIVII